MNGVVWIFIVFPCNGPNLWPLLQRSVMLSPMMRMTLGRQKKQETRVMMSLRLTSSCQDSQNQSFIKNVGKLATTKGHVKARQLLLGTFQKGGIM